MKIFSTLDTRRSIICRGGVTSPWLLNEKSYRRAFITTILYAFHCSPLWNLSPPLFPSFGSSFVFPSSHLRPSPLRSPLLGIILSMEQLIRRPFHPPPPEADSAERSETIKSTAESTLPCKLAHCQAQRFTVTCIAYIYLLTHTFTIITDCHRSLFIEIYHRYYGIIYIVSHRVCARALCKSHVNARRHRVLHVFLAPTTHAYTHFVESECHAANVHARAGRRRSLVPYAPNSQVQAPRFYDQFDCETAHTRARSIHVGHACGRVQLDMHIRRDVDAHVVA